MLRPLPQVPHGYSPGTHDSVPMINRYPPLSDSSASDSSSSPDSLYSAESPTVPVVHTAHLDNIDYEDEVEEHDAEDYEHLLDVTNPFADPVDGEATMPWTPSPKVSPSRKLSVISNASPRGSISGRGESLLKAALLLQGRRASTPSLRDGDDRRRSSTKSLVSSTRRRSSALSNNGSFLDPLEEDRLRSIAAMDLLSRRFSDVVEVSHDDAYGDTYLALEHLRSRWSESSISSLEDLELRTASYVPTPDIPPTQGLVSNYPLASVAEIALNDPSSAILSAAANLSERPSPAIPSRLVQPQSSVAILTPPPPPQPSTMWRERTRPSLLRHATEHEYQFPARLPAAAPARPRLLNRSISAPFFGSSERDKPYAEALALRAAGTFTMARAVPIGTTPLRASVRRESIMSILSDVSSVYSRRSSMVVERTPAPDGVDMDRRFSTNFDGSNSVVNPSARNSIHLNSPRLRYASNTSSQDSQFRRDSTKSSLASMGRRKSSGIDLRRESLDRRASLANTMSSIDLPTSLKMRRGTSSSRAHCDSRRSSEDLRMSLASSRKSSTDQRTNMSSRKSSVVSFGEYGYLASQIVAPSVNGAKRTIPALTISLPPRDVTSWSVHSPISEGRTPVATRPKYDPMNSFLGQSWQTPEEQSIDPIDTVMDATPKGDNGRPSVLDRPRPVGHPEYMDHRAMPKRTVSSKTVPKQDTPVLSIRSSAVFVQGSHDTPSPIKSILKTGGVSRKPVPNIDLDIEDVSVRAEIYQQARRRGAMERFIDDSVDPLEIPSSLEPASVLKRSSSLTMIPTYTTTSAARPGFKRHKTGFSLHGGQHSPADEVERVGRQGSGNHFGRFFKW